MLLLSGLVFRLMVQRESNYKERSVHGSWKLKVGK